MEHETHYACDKRIEGQPNTYAVKADEATKRKLLTPQRQITNYT